MLKKTKPPSHASSLPEIDPIIDVWTPHKPKNGKAKQPVTGGIAAAGKYAKSLVPLQKMAIIPAKEIKVDLPETFIPSLVDVPEYTPTSPAMSKQEIKEEKVYVKGEKKKDKVVYQTEKKFAKIHKKEKIKEARLYPSHTKREKIKAARKEFRSQYPFGRSKSIVNGETSQEKIEEKVMQKQQSTQTAQSTQTPTPKPKFGE